MMMSLVVFTLSSIKLKYRRIIIFVLCTLSAPQLQLKLLLQSYYEMEDNKFPVSPVYDTRQYAYRNSGYNYNYTLFLPDILTVLHRD